ncbi:MAG TPA: hypothetical protein VML54_06910 [Candidatus Limnocylindrales bacterium]|nr:hypothetical protein [Candidatus Limnocylindrales bacterium]
MSTDCGLVEARVSDPALLPDLEAHLQRMGCVTEATNGDRLLVSIPASLRQDAAELELDLYLRLWELQVPSAQAERVR